jgi:hypothetical protein
MENLKKLVSYTARIEWWLPEALEKEVRVGY